MNDRIKVALVTWMFSPNRASSFPGVNRYSVELAKALMARGVEIRVITPQRDALPKYETWGRVEIVRLPDTKSRFGRVGVVAGLHILSFGFGLVRAARLFEDVDVIHMDIPIPIRPNSPLPPILAIVHHVYRVWRGSDLLWVPFGSLLLKRFLSNAAGVAVPSASTAEDIVRLYGVSRKRIELIHHGVDTALFSPQMKNDPRRRGRSRPTLVYAGLLERRKGTTDLLGILTEVQRTIADVRLIIIGAGPEEASMKRRARREHMNRSVEFLGSTSDSELVAALNDADVFISPSRQEGFGFAPVEAMACGKPVVAYDTPTNREIIADAGFLIPMGDTSAFGSTIVDLIRNPQLAVELGTRGQKRATDHFSWNAASQKYVELDKRLLQESRAEMSMP